MINKVLWRIEHRGVPEIGRGRTNNAFAVRNFACDQPRVWKLSEPHRQVVTLSDEVDETIRGGDV